MISDFLYMEVVWKSFFHRIKTLISDIGTSQIILVFFVNEHKWQKPWLLKVDYAKGWTSPIQNALETAWNVLILSYTNKIVKVTNFYFLTKIFNGDFF